MGTALDKYADMKPTWDHPVVIESHINGVRSKEMNPNTPVSHDEITEAAELTGLDEGTPAVSGLHDVDASAIGMGCVEPG